MTDEKILTMADEAGFVASLIPADQVPVNPNFRILCEENQCGQYDANYACPPYCGTTGEMADRIHREDRALVLMTQWDIAGYEDTDGVKRGKRGHNAAIFRLLEALRKEGIVGFFAGSGCCNLCTPCKMASGEPCPHPDKRFSCMSAYCVDVAELAERSGVPYLWDMEKLYCYGMILFHEE